MIRIKDINFLKHAWSRQSKGSTATRTRRSILLFSRNNVKTGVSFSDYILLFFSQYHHRKFFCINRFIKSKFVFNAVPAETGKNILPGITVSHRYKLNHPYTFIYGITRRKPQTVPFDRDGIPLSRPPEILKQLKRETGSIHRTDACRPLRILEL